MKRIDYEKFKDLLLSYSSFGFDSLDALEKEFGSKIVSYFFEKLILEENNEEYFKYCEVYMQKKDNIDDNVVVNFCGVFGAITSDKSKYDILSFDEEREYTKILYEGNKNLSIIYLDSLNVTSNSDNMGYVDELYPKLNLGLIFSSIKDSSCLELLNSIRRLRFTLGDESIWKSERDILKKYVNLCKDGIVSEDVLRKNFSDLDFSTSLSKEDIFYQLELLKKYIIAKNRLYNANVRLVISLARRCCMNSNIDIEEKVQVGCLGLIRAINMFDYTKNTKVSTYATSWIMQRINRFVACNNDSIKKPIHIYYKMLNYNAFIDRYFVEHGSIPSDEIIMKELNCSKNSLDRIKLLSFSILSLDSPYDNEITGGDATLGDYLVSDEKLVEDRVVNKVFCEELVDLLELCLNDSEKDVFLNRVGFNDEDKCYTLEAIGKWHGVTRERIRQIEQNANGKIKKKIRYKEIS